MNAKLAYAIGRRLGLEKKADIGNPGGGGGKSWWGIGDKLRTLGQGIKQIPAYAKTMGEAYQNTQGTQQQKMQAAGEAARNKYYAPITLEGVGGGGAGPQPISLDSNLPKSVQDAQAAGAKRIQAAGLGGGGASGGAAGEAGAGAGAAAGGEAGGQGGVISLDMDPAVRKRIQQGVNPQAAGAYGQPMGKQEQQFYSMDPNQLQNYIGRHFQTYTGFQNPSEYGGWQSAMNAGMGRALKAQKEQQWLRSMFA